MLRARRRRPLLRIAVVVLGAGIAYAGIRFGPAIADLWSAGIIQGAAFEPPKRNYEGSSMDNLKALHMAVSLYHESEGQYPYASGWMDAAKDRVKAADMTTEQAMKKFVNPLLEPASSTVFGYAMNDACSAKYKGDISSPELVPLLFDSSDTTWNAHGDPAKLAPNPPRAGGNLAVMVDGHVTELRTKPTR